MPITEYKLVVASNSEALTDAVNAGGYVPVGDVMASACGSYALQAAGLGTFDVGSATDYEVIQGDTRQELEDRVNAKISEGLQPVGGVIQWHNAFIQVVGTVTGGGGGGGSVAWNDITGKPATFAPTIGTTATTAKAGNYQPTAANISDASAVGRSVLTATDAAAARAAIGAGTSSLAIGTTATTAAAGNHTHGTATTSAAGFMSAADKVKLDAIPDGGGVTPTAAPTITITDPVDDENVQAAFDSLIQALKTAGVLT